MPQVPVSRQEVVKWVPKVAKVLKQATKRADNRNIFLSAYQILQLLSLRERQQLLNKYGQGGLNSGNIAAATTVVQKAAVLVPDVEIMYMESRHVQFLILDNNKKALDVVTPAGKRYFALYRIPTGSKQARRCKLPPSVGSQTLTTRRRSPNRTDVTPNAGNP